MSLFLIFFFLKKKYVEKKMHTLIIVVSHGSTDLATLRHGINVLINGAYCLGDECDRQVVAHLATSATEDVRHELTRLSQTITHVSSIAECKISIKNISELGYLYLLTLWNTSTASLEQSIVEQYRHASDRFDFGKMTRISITHTPMICEATIDDTVSTSKCSTEPHLLQLI